MAPSQGGEYRLSKSAWRFLAVGGANTLVTAVLLALLSIYIDPKLAYGIVFVLGAAFSVVMSPFIYGPRFKGVLSFYYLVLYLSVFLLGIVVVDALVSRTGDDWMSAFVVFVTAPLTFLGGRAISKYARTSPDTK